MFCPGCGNQVSQELKFCKRCGANLLGVRDAMTRPGSENFDWSKTWVAEMFMTQEERERRKGITAEKKRYGEIKGGIVTAVAGLASMIFLKIFLGVVAGAQSNPNDAQILYHVWLAGLVPFLIGLSLIFNGVFLTRREINDHRRRELESQGRDPSLNPSEGISLAEASKPAAPDFSVAEPTTRRIPEKVETPSRREPT